MKITKVRLKKLIDEELRAAQYSQKPTLEEQELAGQIFEKTGVNTSAALDVVSCLNELGLLGKGDLNYRTERLFEDIEMGLNSQGGAATILAKKRGRPELEPPGLQDPHSSGYNTDPDASVSNIQMVSRVLEDLPLEELPEAVSHAAQNLRTALDELYATGPEPTISEPEQTEPPHFRPTR
jgi:hypothetical protein